MYKKLMTMVATPQHDEIKMWKRESSSRFKQHVFGTPQHEEI